MKVVLPADATHNTILIPRYTPTTALTLSLYNEATQVSTDVANSYVISNGFLTITYDFTFAEGDKYQILIKETAEVVFRGKLIATAQTPQDYKQTNGLYTYE